MCVSLSTILWNDPSWNFQTEASIENVETLQLQITKPRLFKTKIKTEIFKIYI